MNPLSLLILISNLHQQLLDAQQENVALQQKIAGLQAEETEAAGRFMGGGFSDTPSGGAE